jgi:VCBS repeat protein/flagellar hook capping protein FlgD
VLRRSKYWLFLGAAMAAIFWTFLPSLALAGDGPFTDFPVWQSPATWGTVAVVLGDVDKDGALDLVTGEEFAPVGFYRNQGASFVPYYDWPGSGRTTSVALGDIDGDGDLDLVCGNAFQPSRIYRNNGPFTTPSLIWQSGPAADRTQSVALGDLDGDGDLDLVCGNAGQPSAIYRNDGGQFTINPIWRSGPASAVFSVALGDLDQDGDLDLVCGNAGGPSTMYRNDGGGFTIDPVWRSGLSSYTTSITLGDVDGDGDLDLVCGNGGQPLTLYRNDGGVFASNPIWDSDEVDNTQCVALGDLDRDGDLDLVCGNSGQPATVYRNDGGLFTVLPIWRSGHYDDTRSVALGDFDGDGALDLACGNYYQSTTVYRNVTGSHPFENNPNWRSALSDDTPSLALADLDQDGDLDLVSSLVTDTNGSATVYRNDAGGFNVDPTWTSGVSGAVRCVALGDLDQDGSPDLVCGNSRGPTTVYRNLGDGSFGAGPAWQSGSGTSYDTRSVALGDVDGDGDLDLVCGNFSQPLVLYRNDGGHLTRDPVWSSWYPPATTCTLLGDLDGDGDLDLVSGANGSPLAVYRNDGTTFTPYSTWNSNGNYFPRSMALGDVDGDGDLDLVCGNEFEQSIVLFRNDGGTFSSNPIWSTGLLGPAFAVALTDLDGDGDLDVVCGNNGQPITVYRNDAGLFTANPIWRSGAVNFTHGLALGDLDQDGDLDLVSGNADGASIYRGTVAPPLPNPLRLANQLPNNSAYLRSVRAVHAGRNSYRVDFQTVDAESDPAWVLAAWQHAGTSSWNPISAAGSPSPLGPLASSPTGIPHAFDWDVSQVPAQSGDVVLRFRTVSNSHTGGLMQEVTNYYVQAGQIDVLAPRMKVLSPQVAFPTTTEGDTSQATLRIQNTGTETLVLYTLGMSDPEIFGTKAAFPDSIPPRAIHGIPLCFSPRSQDVNAWTTTIVSNDILNPFTVVNLGGSVLPLVFTVVNLYPSGEILQGTPLTVSVVMQNEVTADSAFVSYRRGGASSIASRGLTRTFDSLNEQFSGSIPADSVGTRGIDYHVVVANGSVQATSLTYSLRVRVTDMPYASLSRPKQFQMVAVPLEMEGTIAGSLLDDLGAPDPAHWRLFAYDTAESTYHDVPDDRYVRWELGRGYWIVTAKTATLDTGPEQGLSTSSDSAFAAALAPGWNLIGNPYQFPVAWDQVWVEGFDTSILEPPVRWDGNAGEYDPNPVTVLQPFEGYWVKNLAAFPVTLRIPAQEVITRPRVSPQTAGIRDDGGWRIRVLASSGTARDDASIVGEAPGAAETWDPADRSDPPLAPGPAISVCFPHPDWGPHAGLYTADIRPFLTGGTGSNQESEDGRTWDFDVRTAGFEEGGLLPVDLEFDGIAGVPPPANVILKDRALGRIVDLRSTPRYTYFPGGYPPNSGARFELQVGADSSTAGSFDTATLPRTTRLLPNRPNPFRSSTVLRYELADAGHVLLRVFDLQGRLVRALEDRERPAGRYEVAWQGEDDRNRPVPPGVYFLQITIPGSSQTQKILRIQ